jgi:carboxypeptidase C (cathepsin A)
LVDSLGFEGATMALRFVFPVVVSLLFLTNWAPTAAQQPDRKDEKERAEPFSEVDGAVTIAGTKVEYKATTGRLAVKDMTGKATAKICFTAYTRKVEGSPANRPILFAFGGGPGSSSQSLHIGLFGPRRLLIDEDGKSLPLPPKLVENESSVLDVIDVVIIDPVSVGFSRADDPKEAKLFHGLEEDTQSVGDFIRAYAVKHDRTASPAYVVGLSYGTTRAASLSRYLQTKGGVKLAGVVLIAVVLDFQTIEFVAGNDLPYSLFLPTYTAAAWHHKKLDTAWARDFATALEESRRFADGPYTLALRKGNQLNEDERVAMAKSLAKFTGLSEEFVLKSDLRIEAGKFRAELLRESQELIGRYDSRVKAKVKGGGGKGGGNDPSSTLLSGPYSEALKEYLASVLNYKTDLKYVTTAPVQPWSYGKAGNNRFANVAPRLRSALENDKKLRVLVCSGYMDLATPFAATNYTFAHVGPRPLLDRVMMKYYEAGHAMYSHQPSRRQLSEDIRKFVTAVPGNADSGAELLSFDLVQPAFSFSDRVR